MPGVRWGGSNVAEPRARDASLLFSPHALVLDPTINPSDSILELLSTVREATNATGTRTCF